MLVANGPGWHDHRKPNTSWSSLAISILSTAALFASAFIAMRAVPLDFGRRTADREATTVVRLAPPPVPVPLQRDERAADRQPATSNTAPVVVPKGIEAAPVITQPATKAPPIVRAPNDAQRDSGANTPIAAPGVVPLQIIDGVHHAGAPIAPAGVTGARPPLTSASRDSILSATFGRVPFLAATRAPNEKERAELEQRARMAARVADRATTAGNSHAVIVMQGDGVDGDGAVGGNKTLSDGAVHVPFTLFSSGPSAAERKRNEAIDRDYRLRLARLDDRARLEKDSVRLDSLRRDSLQRNANAKRKP
jgi:hypothetical protein